MFTGLVQRIGSIFTASDEGPGRRLCIESLEVAASARVGDSIAVNGCCLTVVEATATRIAFEAGPETLSRTNLGDLGPGNAVNLEASLRVGEALGGHFVTGHIDGKGTLDQREDDQDWSTLWFRTPAKLTRQMISKGSIAVDGVSLTLVDVESDRFSVQLIPHTLMNTTLGKLSVGDNVNIETDLLAKYAQKAIRPGI